MGFIISPIKQIDLSLIDLPSSKNKLKEELVKYRLIAEHTFDMVVWILADGSITYISPSCKNLTGYPPEKFEIETDLLYSLLHPDDRQNYLDQLQECFKKDRSQLDNCRIIKKDGTTKWIRTLVKHILGPKGEGLGLRVTIRDISDKIRIEEELKNSYELYKKVVGDQIDLVIRYYPDGKISFMNQSALDFFNLKSQKVLGNNFRDVFTKEDILRCDKLIEKIDSENQINSEIVEFDNQKNKKIFIEWLARGLFDSEGILSEYQIIGRDISKIIETRKQLEDSEFRYKAIVETQKEIVLRHKVDSTLVFVNPAFCNFTGLREKDIINKKWFDMVDSELIEYSSQIMKNITPDNNSIHTGFLVDRADGEKRWLDISSTGIFNETGELIEFQVTGHDITELKKAQNDLKETLEELREIKEKMEVENTYLREKYQPAEINNGIIAQSPLMREVLDKIHQVAKTNSPVLIMGETGTGKELIANAIHNSSDRSNKLMITVNCAAMPTSLIESELFGREKGAYTGAMSRQVGRFQMADGSTIFLDEIGELPFEIQAKLLRVLQFGEFEMLGNPVTRKVDVRIIAATNLDLHKAVEDKKFRADLFYRLNVFPVEVPPLRDRKQDIPILSWAFIDEIGAQTGKKIDKISSESIKNLVKYPWPGNVRELRNIIEYSIIMCHSTTLEVRIPEVTNRFEVTDNLENSQRTHIVKVLEQSGWKIRGKGGAAEKLGMKESTLRYRMKKLDIERKQ